MNDYVSTKGHNIISTTQATTQCSNPQTDKRTCTDYPVVNLSPFHSLHDTRPVRYVKNTLHSTHNKPVSPRRRPRGTLIRILALISFPTVQSCRALTPVSAFHLEVCVMPHSLLPPCRFTLNPGFASFFLSEFASLIIISFLSPCRAKGLLLFFHFSDPSHGRRARAQNAQNERFTLQSGSLMGSDRRCQGKRQRLGVRNGGAH